jgi:hypothetical protein
MTARARLEIPAPILRRTLLSILEGMEKPAPGQPDRAGLWFTSPAGVRYSVNRRASHWTISRYGPDGRRGNAATYATAADAADAMP